MGTVFYMFEQGSKKKEPFALLRFHRVSVTRF